MEMTKSKSQDVVIERTFDAPRELVWRAWTDPELYKQWWGPEYFTCPVATIDARPGGRWHSAMADPEGNLYWSTGTFREVVPFERLVMTDSFSDEHGNLVLASQLGMGDDIPLEMLITVVLEDLGNGRTRMTIYHSGMPDGEMKEMAKQGMSTSLNKLEAVLAAAH
jgi:uncharacterized protein YndB with AHSA1/START domain